MFGFYMNFTPVKKNCFFSLDTFARNIYSFPGYICNFRLYYIFLKQHIFMNGNFTLDNKGNVPFCPDFRSCHDRQINILICEKSFPVLQSTP